MTPDTPDTPHNGPLLEVTDLTKHFAVHKGLLQRVAGHVQAVDGVTLSVAPGETLGIVGESGCGKSTAGRMMTRLLTPTSGQVRLRGKDIAGIEDGELRRNVQMIFQDPYSSLNPRMTAGAIVMEPLIIHRIGTPDERKARTEDLFRRVGLREADMHKLPSEFSGGQRQRIGIARALALDPSVIVCDEPVSALDASIQAQVVNLLMDLQQELGIAYVFIAHDLSIVYHISHRVAVMYLGKLVELADRATLYSNPRHPYTKALLSSVPSPDPTVSRGERMLLAGDLPSPINPPSGCRFHTRCPVAISRCKSEVPAFKPCGDGHMVACHLVEGDD
ncbi:ABC transporter ATP-binding protein [Hoeflea ulvae]|uniref:Dipeptide ABC transporter ATP-binding protein n=1 Tax=Hoeflea ulvae TaxID=2983764 RepID=A0ABT3YCZ6_9HYPH|nr:dipeptide ABC transporter ATP-binding protein [Hoeflea ulvae]MCY0093751.1 dipeptide ABC transporter ATP-binding protein [Hoeflea ulvae]